MIYFRKIAVAGAGKGHLLRKFFTEDLTEDDRISVGQQVAWRDDMPPLIERALGIDEALPPTDAELDRLFEGCKADDGKVQLVRPPESGCYELTLAPHVSVTLAAEFAPSAAENAAIWNAIAQANDDALRLAVRALEYTTTVGWVSFYNSIARPTLVVADGRHGQTYPMAMPVESKPRAHVHNLIFNLTVGQDGTIAALDVRGIERRLDEIEAFFQARLADELRGLGVAVALDRTEREIVITAIPERAIKTFGTTGVATGDVWQSEEDLLA